MMKKYNLMMIMVLAQVFVFGQLDTSITLISKIDAFPQFQLSDNNQIYMMGYTQTIGGAIDIPAPTLNFTEGDSVELNLWNLSQGPPHTIHLHGLDVDQANDGVPALSFAVAHDDTGSYYFRAPQAGNYIYHCHETSVLHVQAGMYGMVIVRPQSADTLTWDGGYSFHSENTWMMSEIDTNWHVDSIINHDHDPNATTHHILDYVPQHFLVNGRSEQQLDGSSSELNMSVGEKKYLRLANIGYLGNKIIFPASLNALIVASDGRPLPSAYSSDTLTLLPGERYGVMLTSSSTFVDSIQIDYFSLNNGTTENSQYVNVEVEGYLGVVDGEDWKAAIYPNPVMDDLMIRLPSSDGEIKNVRLMNTLGQEILSSSFTELEKQLSLKHLDSGTYFLEINYKNENRLSKIIKH